MARRILPGSDQILLMDNGEVRIGNAANYTAFEPNGFMEFNGDAVAYDDVQVALSSARRPAASAPTWRNYAFGVGGGITYEVLGFAVGDYIDFYIQTQHAMKLNTILEVHLHFTLPNTTDVGDLAQFQLDVIAAGIDTAWAVPTGSPFTAEHTVAANDDTYHRYLNLAEIPASNDTVSSIYICRMTRIAASVPANEYGSEVYAVYVDAHFQKNTAGSRLETSK